MYCIANEVTDKFIIGSTKKDVISRICEWNIDERNILVFKVEGWTEAQGEYCDPKLSKAKRTKQIIDYIWNELPKYHWILFKQI